MDQDLKCPCGSKLVYAHCCAPFHSGEKIPPTAEALMRSRYVAFCLQNAGYLLATWDISTRPAHIDFSNDDSQWLRLEIASTQKGLATDSQGKVSFKAYFVQDGKEAVMEETSRFRKIAGRWFYQEGVVKFAEKNPPVQGRNGLCPCGSGKKFKRCCME